MRIKRKTLKKLRHQQNWSQKKVVELLWGLHGIKITSSYYGMIEQGIRTPNLKLAIAISKIFNREVDEIFFDQIPNIRLGDEVV